MNLQSGDIIGSYRVIRPHGEGGMGVVYEVAALVAWFFLPSFDFDSQLRLIRRERLFHSGGRQMSAFPETSTTLLARLVATQTGESEDDLVVPSETAAILDAKWRLAAH